jgi:hypothetical protein
MAAYDLGDAACWDRLWRSYVEEVDLCFACNIMGGLQHFVRSLRAALSVEDSYYPASCQRVCLRECLMLSLLSSLQHGAGREVVFCLDQLMPRGERQDDNDLAAAAMPFVHGLSQGGLRLLPVPLSVIQSIVESCSCPMSCRASLN